MIQGYGPVTQALLGTLLTWGLTAAGAACVIFLRGNQVRHWHDKSRWWGFFQRHHDNSRAIGEFHVNEVKFFELLILDLCFRRFSASGELKFYIADKNGYIVVIHTGFGERTEFRKLMEVNYQKDSEERILDGWKWF
jgi:hypothetical protein